MIYSAPMDSSPSGRTRRFIESFFAFCSRAFARSPSLEVFLAIASLIALVCAVLPPLVSALQRTSFALISNEDLNAIVCCLAMAIFSILFPIIRSARLFRSLLAAKLAFLSLYLISFPAWRGTETAVVATFLAEIAIYEAFFLNLLVCFAVFLVSVFIVSINAITLRFGPLIGIETLGRWEVVTYFWRTQGPHLILFILVSIAFSLLIYYREKCIDQRDRISQLDGVVARLTVTNLGYQNYAQDAAFRSRDEERRRITRELHDIIGYTFTNNIMMMEAAVTKIHKEPDRVGQLIELARENAQEGLTKIRESLYRLRNTEHQKEMSMRRIHELVSVFRIATEVNVVVDFGGMPSDLEEDVEHFFYYFVQEALTNAFLHGGASEILVRLYRGDGVLGASVLDNGSGAESIVEGIGLSGMRERSSALGGILKIRNSAHSFEVVGEIPYPIDRKE